MPTNDVLTIAQIAGGVVVALLMIAAGMQQILKNWKNNNTENALLQMMHTELGRMSTQNSALSLEIGKLQIEIIALSTQLTRLTTENQKLQHEVANLNEEIARLHGLMSKKDVEDGSTSENQL